MDEPVAFIDVTNRTLEWAKPTRWETPTVVKMDKVPLYVKKEWVGLTDEELSPIYAEYKSPRNIYLAIESALREKNT